MLISRKLRIKYITFRLTVSYTDPRINHFEHPKNTHNSYVIWHSFSVSTIVCSVEWMTSSTQKHSSAHSNSPRKHIAYWYELGGVEQSQTTMFTLHLPHTGGWCKAFPVIYNGKNMRREREHHRIHPVQSKSPFPNTHTNTHTAERRHIYGDRMKYCDTISIEYFQTAPFQPASETRRSEVSIA